MEAKLNREARSLRTNAPFRPARHTYPILFKFISETGRFKEIRNYLNFTRDEMEEEKRAEK